MPPSLPSRRTGTPPRPRAREHAPLDAEEAERAGAGLFAPAVFDERHPATLSRNAWREDARFVASLRASWKGQYADYLGEDEAGRVVAALERRGSLYRHHVPGTLLASLDGRPVGVAAVRPMGDLSLITLLEVLPAYRGRGIGSQLLRALCTVRGALMAHVSIHRPRVRELYVAAGFAVLERATVEHGTHRLEFDVVARTCRPGRTVRRLRG